MLNYKCKIRNPNIYKKKKHPFDRNYFPFRRTGNYYDLNSHKNPILDFVQQMVSEKRGDTLRQIRCDGGECRQEY